MSEQADESTQIHSSLDVRLSSLAEDVRQTNIAVQQQGQQTQKSIEHLSTEIGRVNSTLAGSLARQDAIENDHILIRKDLQVVRDPKWSVIISVVTLIFAVLMPVFAGIFGTIYLGYQISAARAVSLENEISRGLNALKVEGQETAKARATRCDRVEDRLVKSMDDEMLRHTSAESSISELRARLDTWLDLYRANKLNFDSPPPSK